MSLINDALKKANEAQREKREESQAPLGVPVHPVAPLRKPGPSMFQIVGVICLLTVLGVSAWAFVVWWKAQNATAPQPIVQSPGIPAAPTANHASGRPAVTTPANANAAPLPKQPVQVAKAPAQPPVPPVSAKIPPTQTATPPSPPVAVAQATPTATAPNPTKPESPAASPATVAPPETTPSAPIKPTPPVAVIVPPAVAQTPPPTPAPVEVNFPTGKLQAIFFRLKNPSIMMDGKMLGLNDELDGARVKDIQRTSVTLEKDGQTRTYTMN